MRRISAGIPRRGATFAIGMSDIAVLKYREQSRLGIFSRGLLRSPDVSCSEKVGEEKFRTRSGDYIRNGRGIAQGHTERSIEGDETFYPNAAKV